jgi:WD40 repeat protein
LISIHFIVGHRGPVRAVAVSPDGRHAVSASEDHTLKVWDLETGRELRTLTGHSAPVSGVSINPDGRRAVSTSFDRTLRLWDYEAGLYIAGFHCDGPAICCAFADQRRVVAGDENGRVYALSLEAAADPEAGLHR